MRNEILQGDVLEMLATLSAESINCIITSPPYFGLRDYQLPPTNWPEVSYTPMAGLPEITIPAMSCCFGLEDTIEAYVGHMVLVWRGLWRVLRGDGVGWLNLGDSYAGNGKSTGEGEKRSLKTEKFHGGQAHLEQRRIVGNHGLPPKNLIGIPWRVAFALQADGWYLRSDVIWAKLNPMPESVTDRPTKAHEYLFLLAKSERYWWDQEAIREPSTNQNGQAANFARSTKEDLCPNQTSIQHRKNRKSTDDNGCRNKRTVWAIATKPFKSAHFAVMPEALVEPCLLAGCPAQVCAECGEPWVRVVERGELVSSGPNKLVEKPRSSNRKPGAKSLSERPKDGYGDLPRRETKTIAHTPTCQCSAPTRPGVVLDPFVGSGTVGVVATQFMRHWLGIELNPDYAKIARQRLDQTQPALFAR
jgi:DNA modification methylase